MLYPSLYRRFSIVQEMRMAVRQTNKIEFNEKAENRIVKYNKGHWFESLLHTPEIDFSGRKEVF